MAVLIIASLLGSFLLAGWSGIRALRDRPVIFVQLKAAGVVEVIMVVMSIWALVARPAEVDGILVLGYLATALLFLPGAGIWAFADRTRWSSVVMLVANLSLAAMNFRIGQIWGSW